MQKVYIFPLSPHINLLYKHFLGTPLKNIYMYKGTYSFLYDQDIEAYTKIKNFQVFTKYTQYQTKDTADTHKTHTRTPRVCGNKNQALTQPSSIESRNTQLS